MDPSAPTRITRPKLAAKPERTGSTDALQTYVNNQPDWLHALLVHAAQERRVVQDPNVVEFDEHGLVVMYHLPGSDGAVEEHRARIDFDEPIKSWADLRPTVLKMKNAALAALSVPEDPKLARFEYPDLLPELFVILVLLFFQCAFLLGSATSPLPVLRRIADIRETFLPGGLATVKGSYVFLVVAHAAEAVWFLGFLRRRGSVRREDLWKYMLETLAVGLVVAWPNYQRALQRERIRGIYAHLSSVKKGAPSGEEEGKKAR